MKSPHLIEPSMICPHCGEPFAVVGPDPVVAYLADDFRKRHFEHCRSRPLARPQLAHDFLAALSVWALFLGAIFYLFTLAL